MSCRKVEVAIMASFPAKGDVNVDASHTIFSCLNRAKIGTIAMKYKLDFWLP
jgi:hypothetical protein